MSGSVVVDTSLAVKWVLEEDYAAEAAALLDLWTMGNIARTVPSWFGCEVTNVLLKNVLRRSIGVPEARDALSTVLNETISWDEEPALSIRALDLAVTLAQPASYDCHYLALAEYLDCELWTADARFWNVAKGAFPRVRWVGEVTRPR